MRGSSNPNPIATQILTSVLRARVRCSAWCKANVDPAKCRVPGFDKANTEAAEIAFAWLARSKHILRNRNEARFLFFILRLAELRNRQLCDTNKPPEADACVDDPDLQCLPCED